jgi:predicted DNA-binding transcriptional regulator AlpA
MRATNQTTSTPFPELMTLHKAAEMCSVSDRLLWGWAHEGISPPPVTIGKGTVRYVRSDYQAWFDGGCKPIQGGLNHDR